MHSIIGLQARFLLRTVIGIVCILLIVGSLFIYSSSTVYALTKHGTSTFYVIKQLWGIAIGILCMTAVSMVPIMRIKSAVLYVFVGSWLLTCLTLISGLNRTVHGASRWLSLAGLTFQPSELLKYMLLLFVAQMLARTHSKRNSIIQYCLIMISVAFVCAVLLLQPDFGMAVTIACTVFILLFIARCNLRLLACVLVAGILAVSALIMLYPYRLARIAIFLNPWSDPHGAGFQIIQSLIAIGSGEIWGTGIAHSRQKYFYLPMQHTDFIFSIIAEEIGFVGCIGIISGYIALLLYGMKLARTMRDPFCYFVVLGFTILITLQAMTNMAVATGLVPTKGLNLPFISYGNTCLVSTFIMLGVICSCVRDARREWSFR